MAIKKLLVFILLGLMLATASAQAGGDAAKGKELSVDCVDCHGEDGLGDEDIPAVAGLEEAKQIEALKAYASGARVDETESMGDLAKELSEQDMADLAAYYASLPGK